MIKVVEKLYVNMIRLMSYRALTEHTLAFVKNAFLAAFRVVYPAAFNKSMSINWKISKDAVKIT